MNSQLPLIEDALDTRIRTAAAAWGITRIVFFESRTATYREVKNASASGPDLDDYEAAVLVAAGIKWTVYQPWKPSRSAA